MEHSLRSLLDGTLLAEPAGPPQEGIWEDDGGGDAALLSHPVDLYQVASDHLVGEEHDGDTRELHWKYRLMLGSYYNFLIHNCDKTTVLLLISL